jgi:hypothetical protein
MNKSNLWEGLRCSQWLAVLLCNGAIGPRLRGGDVYIFSSGAAPEGSYCDTSVYGSRLIVALFAAPR